MYLGHRTGAPRPQSDTIYKWSFRYRLKPLRSLDEWSYFESHAIVLRQAMLRASESFDSLMVIRIYTVDRDDVKLTFITFFITGNRYSIVHGQPFVLSFEYCSSDNFRRTPPHPFSIARLRALRCLMHRKAPPRSDASITFSDEIKLSVRGKGDRQSSSMNLQIQLPLFER
jgi:hypothetical protein